MPDCVFLKITKKNLNNISQLTYNGSCYQVTFGRMAKKNLNNTVKGNNVHKAVG